MKTTILKQLTIILCFLLLLPSFTIGQEVDNSLNKTPQEMHDMFMKKNKTNKTVALVTLGAGIALAGAGQAIIYNDLNNFYGRGLFVLGGVSTIVSIPCYFCGS